ncbi:MULTISPECIES: PTS sugar transporter subunit IIB [Enterococcus]|uniref:PTS sugar transporter subunit IIB n=1 Tax=Enterococcus TaxID=1350 RepID=UPI0037B7D876
MKIICVCAMGLGSSLILRMSVESALKGLDVDHVQVEVVDTSTARGSGADIVVSSESFCKQLSDMNVPMIEVVNYADSNYIREELKKIIDGL